MFERFNKQLSKMLKKRPPTASNAKKRLQIVLAHDHDSSPVWMDDLKEELILVISKYVKIGHGDLDINMDKDSTLDVLKINVSLPEQP